MNEANCIFADAKVIFAATCPNGANITAVGNITYEVNITCRVAGKYKYGVSHRETP